MNMTLVWAADRGGAVTGSAAYASAGVAGAAVAFWHPS